MSIFCLIAFFAIWIGVAMGADHLAKRNDAKLHGSNRL